jgi:hypothetical protein
MNCEGGVDEALRAMRALAPWVGPFDHCTGCCGGGEM